MANAVFYLMEPTSISYTGTSASISANGSVTFSACTTLSMNGVFTSDYDNYMIVWGGTQTSTVSLHWRYRVSGSDDSTASSYVSQRFIAESTNVSGFRLTQNYAYLGVPVSTLRSGYIVNIYGPALAQPTAHRSIGVSAADNAYIYEFAGTHNQSTAYDGITLISDAGQNETGRVAVYGMRK